MPGRFILFAAGRMLPPRHTTLLVQPAIADLQHEWARARTTGPLVMSVAALVATTLAAPGSSHEQSH